MLNYLLYSIFFEENWMLLQLPGISLQINSITTPLNSYVRAFKMELMHSFLMTYFCSGKNRIMKIFAGQGCTNQFLLSFRLSLYIYFLCIQISFEK